MAMPKTRFVYLVIRKIPVWGPPLSVCMNVCVQEASLMVCLCIYVCIYACECAWGRLV